MGDRLNPKIKTAGMFRSCAGAVSLAAFLLRAVDIDAGEKCQPPLLYQASNVLTALSNDTQRQKIP